MRRSHAHQRGMLPPHPTSSMWRPAHLHQIHRIFVNGLHGLVEAELLADSAVVTDELVAVLALLEGCALAVPDAGHAATPFGLQLLQLLDHPLVAPASAERRGTCSAGGEQLQHARQGWWARAPHASADMRGTGSAGGPLQHARGQARDRQRRRAASARARGGGGAQALGARAHLENSRCCPAHRGTQAARGQAGAARDESRQRGSGARRKPAVGTRDGDVAEAMWWMRGESRSARACCRQGAGRFARASRWASALGSVNATGASALRELLLPSNLSGTPSVSR